MQTPHLEHLFWDVDFLKKNEFVRSPAFGIRPGDKSVSYPIRLLRYWFMYHFIQNEFLKRKHPLSVCEVGVDTGQMLQFMTSVVPDTHAPARWSKWAAVDCIIRKEELLASGYTDLMECNIEKDTLPLLGTYDVMILLHVLEHLHDPEKVMDRLFQFVAKGGIAVGGFPVVPHIFCETRERQLRKRNIPFGHVSVFSVKRVAEMARSLGAKLEYVTGTFFLRSRGSALENFKWWTRLNLLWGALFPRVGGELYWVMRKI